KKGNINKFGSITIYNNNSIYRIIFHIEKGRIRYEKL
ncbi:TPA: type II secretion system protein, partial [Staphylococcus aureus]|nr:type II secretion system protein [Staphylococcus aureus]HED5954379.1 type II secretion system protein [Staphylococcus aureus]